MRLFSFADGEIAAMMPANCARMTAGAAVLVGNSRIEAAISAMVAGDSQMLPGNSAMSVANARIVRGNAASMPGNPATLPAVSHRVRTWSGNDAPDVINDAEFPRITAQSEGIAAQVEPHQSSYFRHRCTVKTQHSGYFRHRRTVERIPRASGRFLSLLQEPACRRP